MKKIVLFILLAFSLSLFSQENKNFTFDLGLSQTYKGFFYLYDGLVDIGIGYNIKLTGNLFGGLSFHVDYLNRKNTPAKTFVYRPKLDLFYRFNVSPRFSIVPVVSVGYSFLNLVNKEFDYSETQQGINTAAELRFAWNTKKRIDYYLFGRYDYIYLDKDEDFTRLEYFRNVHLSGFGIGIKIKPKNYADE